MDSLATPSEKVKTLTVVGAHNCCNSCAKDIASSAKAVAGVKDIDVKAKTDSFTVTGDFDAKELVSALEKAGYHFSIKK
jgi:copper chaperone CopZ